MSKPSRPSAASLSVVPLAPPTTLGRLPGHTPISAPEHLEPATKAWFEELANEIEFETWHLRVLATAAEAWDRKEQARKAIAVHGLVFTDEKGAVRARPEVAMERDARVAFLRAMRELDLDAEGPKESRRPPAIPSNRGA